MTVGYGDERSPTKSLDLNYDFPSATNPSFLAKTYTNTIKDPDIKSPGIIPAINKELIEHPAITAYKIILMLGGIMEANVAAAETVEAANSLL